MRFYIEAIEFARTSEEHQYFIKQAIYQYEQRQLHGIPQAPYLPPP